MDLRTWVGNTVKGENFKKVRLSLEQIKDAVGIYQRWQSVECNASEYEVPELYRSVKVFNKDLNEAERRHGVNTIESMDYTLTPSKYIRFIDHDLEINFEEEMKRIQNEMKEILKEEKKSQQMLEDAFEGIGYGINEN